MKYLITGATGLLGKQVLRLFDAQDELHLLGRSKHDASTPSTFIYSDLSQPLDLNALPKEIDAVLHLAQSPLYRMGPGGNRDVFHVNVSTTHALLEYSRNAGAKTFLFASSGSVYSPKNTPHVEEEFLTSQSPRTHYAASKLAAETLAESYSNDFRVLLPRYFFLFGEGQDKNMFLPRLISTIARNEPVSLAGDNGIEINPTPAWMAARATLDLLKSSSQGVFNIASQTETSIRDIAECIAGELSVRASFIQGAKSDNVLASTQKFCNEIGSLGEIDLLKEVRPLIREITQTQR